MTVNKELVQRLITHYKATPIEGWSDTYCVRGMLTQWGIIGGYSGAEETSEALGITHGDASNLVYAHRVSEDITNELAVRSLEGLLKTGKFEWRNAS